jgi:hypothetical protein
VNDFGRGTFVGLREDEREGIAPQVRNCVRQAERERGCEKGRGIDRDEGLER